MSLLLLSSLYDIPVVSNAVYEMSLDVMTFWSNDIWSIDSWLVGFSQMTFGQKTPEAVFLVMCNPSMNELRAT